MQLKDIGIDLWFLAPIREKDKNGMLYTEEAIKKACEDARGVPITAYNKNGEEVVIGFTDYVEYSDQDKGFKVCGHLWHGGTTEYVQETHDLDLVTKCKIASFTFC
jgi:hypothetical protein